ncbi:MAG: SPOR domain-containing protein, partial [Lachnospiraceae bacterium]|nr:SPOR domain-containing protein [Lachnospiraceae bacterium]
SMDIFRREVAAVLKEDEPENPKPETEVPAEPENPKPETDVPGGPQESTGIIDTIWLGWVKRESGAAGFRQTNGDSGNAYGKYQFDRRYSLVSFMSFCRDYSSARYAGFGPYISYGSGNSKLKGNQALAHLWITFCDRYPAEFEALQDNYAYHYYYLEAKKYIQNLYGIVMEKHSPALRGTLFSMAIRSGTLTGARKFEGCSDQTPDDTMMDRAYSKYGSVDGGRWTRAGQWGDALTAWRKNEYTQVSTIIKADSTEPQKTEPWLRVRKSWTDAGSQIGAFEDLQRAKNLADANPGYRVFDEKGNVVYAGKPAVSLVLYLVQTGSFEQRENAENLLVQLKKAGFAAVIKSVSSQYQVQSGAFQEKKNAETLQKRLQAAGFPAIIK